MDLTPYLAALREDLTTTASAGDEQTRRVAATLSAALEPAVRLTLMNALSDLAAEITAHLDDQVVEVRLDGKDVRVVVSGSATDQGKRDDPDADAPPPPRAEGDISRMTLRLFEEIKGKAEQAAAEQGVSLNTFVQQAVQGALHRKGGWSPGKSGGHGERRGKPDSGGGRLHGWVTG
ncbi:toxin-antitoxin system HicB family antitoxin [Haloechinothrix salitolerans]|uniref:Toxin-antitoxin system HicB family antitoxin n=1 Tax=Haloechinothrix salitolerans TaxID=926830 RepID=A0ABW2BZ34_9PSEU